MIDTIRGLVHWYPVRVLFFALTPVVALWFAILGTVPMETNSALLALTVVVVPVVLVGLASSEAGARTWALERGAQFAPQWNHALQRHLMRTRLARTVGFTLGIAMTLMLMSRYNAEPESFSWFVDEWTGSMVGWWVSGFGYVVGSWWAEWTKPRLDVGAGAGAAVLTPRRIGDYLDPSLRWFLAGAWMLLAAATLIWGVRTSTLEQPTVTTVQPGLRWPAILGPLVVAGLAVALAWWTCRRRERTPDDAALAFEELTRTATINALAGVTVAMSAELAFRLVSSPPADPNWFWWQVPFSLASIVGLAVWASAGTKLVFRNRRIDSIRAAT